MSGEETNNLSGKDPCGGVTPRGRLYFWSVLSGFLVFMLVRPFIPDKLVPLEKIVVKSLPFTYLSYHHSIFQEIFSLLTGLLAAWLVSKALKLTSREIGAVKPERGALLPLAAVAGGGYYLLALITGFYKWIFIDGMLLHKFEGAARLLWAWPGHSVIRLTEPFARLDAYLISFGLKNIFISPLVEEFIFRGVLFAALRRRMTPVRAIVFIAMFDVLLHYNIMDIFRFCASGTWGPQDAQLMASFWHIPNLFIFSLVAGWFRYRSDSLWPAVLFHMTYNLFIGVVLWKVVAP